MLVAERIFVRLARFLIVLFGVFCTGQVSGQVLPEVLEEAFRQAGIEENSAGILVQALDEREPLIALNTDIAFHPASTMKVVTTYAALELLGPYFHWKTDAYITGRLENGILDGDLIIRGSGDPSFSAKELWLFIHEIRNSGIREIRGNIILDGSIFGKTGYDPAIFDGAPLKPYNAGSDGLLFNDRKVEIGFVPYTDRDEIGVTLEPHMDGIDVIPPIASSSACTDWQKGISVHIDDGIVYLEGEYPLVCGRKKWAVHPYQMSLPRYFGSIFTSVWRESGGGFNGHVMEGVLPQEAQKVAQWTSPALGVVVNEVNKHSNNVRARQILLTVGWKFYGNGVLPEDGAKAIETWLLGKGITADGLVIENGSGLSRKEKITPSTMAEILMAAYRSPVMPELISSLPIVGRDGTMSKRLINEGVAGMAHVKTGAINEVRAIAGYVLAKSGRRYLLVCMINHPEAKAARPILDRLLVWTYENG